MKLCPQCEFIYEDEQSLCDMDGHKLVSASEPLGSPRDSTLDLQLGSITIEQSARLSEPPNGSLKFPPANVQRTRQSSGFAFAAVSAVILVALLLGAYYARTRQLQTGAENQAAARDDSKQLPSPDFGSVPSASLVQSPSPDESREQSPSSPELTPLPPSSVASPARKSANRARLASSPVSASGSSGSNRAPVNIRLTNGASIKADEAWERKEGIWYRQAGVVTFLKRGRVQEINRLANSHLQTQSAAMKPQAKNSNPDNLIAQSQSRFLTPENSIARTEPTAGRRENSSAKKESRMSSLLKRTGRILSKPFKL